MIKKGIAFHPVLFALYPVLSLFLHNWKKLPLREATGTMVFVLLCTLLLWLFVDLFVRDRNKSAIVVSVFVLLFFSYNHFVYATTLVLYYTQVADVVGFLANARLGLLAWLCVWSILFGAAVYFTIKSSSSLSLARRVLNVVSLTLVVATVAGWYFNYDDGASAYSDSWQRGIYSEEHTNYASIRPDSLPDIYYIILDGYGRDDILQELYQIDNSEFLSYLTQEGFCVADRSSSNYSQTALSLASSLNYMYLDELADRIGANAESRRPLEVMIEDSLVSEQLRSYGYIIYAFSSGYPITEVEGADVYMSPKRSLNAFQNELINTTPLPIFLLRSQYDLHRHRITYTLDHLADAAQIDSPTFVFAHILAPHPPFVFGENGEHIYPLRNFAFDDGSDFTAIAGRHEYVGGYRGQLAFTTARLQVVIDQILSQSPEPPIIIVQADHGPGSMLEWRSIQHTNLSERMSIFNAYYFPDQTCDSVYPDITPVNTFRIVLNRYFGKNYEILEDRNYFSSTYRPYLFVDVTDEVR